MNIKDFSDHFHLNAAAGAFLEKYGFTQISSQLENIPESLSKDFILRQLQLLHRPIDSGLLLQAAEELRQDRYLLSAYNFLYHYWFKHPSADLDNYTLPDFAEVVPDDKSGLYYLLLILASFPVIIRKFADLDLPGNIATDTLQYIQGAMDEYASGHAGAVGIAEHKMVTFRLYAEGRIFRLGRLEFMLQDPWNYLPAAYRRKSDGKVIALCRHGWKLSGDGLQLFRDDPPEKAYLTATLERNENTISGVPINPAGFAEVKRRITLDLHEYTPLWNPWDLVPGVHIPGGGRMDLAACRDSFEQALEFFPRYFRRKVAAFSCFSWILNPDFEREMPGSNLAKFMQNCYLVPFASGGSEGLKFVFGRSDQDWSHYPADNTLRRAFHNIRSSGRRLKNGAMFIDLYGIKNFGQSIYRQDHSAFDGL